MTRSLEPVAREADPEDPASSSESSSVFVANARDSGRRLDLVVSEHFRHFSRSRITHLAQQGRILVDGQPRKPAFHLRPGQRVEMRVPPPEPMGVRPEPIPLSVVYEDPDLMVVDKPAGLTVHPAPGHTTGTLVNAVLAHSSDLSGIGGILRPGIVHRLDKDTSGVLLIAKTDEAHRSLAAQLRAHTVLRTYLAIVRGSVRKDAGVISAPLGRHPVHRTRITVTPRGRSAVTHFAVLERFPGATLVACQLETGRTHQIRVHMTHVGHPLLGDPVYGRARVPDIQRQALHAARVEFTHPRTGRRLTCMAPLPEDFQRLLDRLRKEAEAAGRSESTRRSAAPRGEK